MRKGGGVGGGKIGEIFYFFISLFRACKLYKNKIVLLFKASLIWNRDLSLSPPLSRSISLVLSLILSQPLLSFLVPPLSVMNQFCISNNTLYRQMSRTQLVLISSYVKNVHNILPLRNFFSLLKSLLLLFQLGYSFYQPKGQAFCVLFAFIQR